MADIWFHGDSILEVVEHFSYLGMMFSSTGGLSGTQQDLAELGSWYGGLHCRMSG